MMCVCICSGPFRDSVFNATDGNRQHHSGHSDVIITKRGHIRYEGYFVATFGQNIGDNVGDLSKKILSRGIRNESYYVGSGPLRN